MFELCVDGTRPETLVSGSCAKCCKVEIESLLMAHFLYSSVIVLVDVLDGRFANGLLAVGSGCCGILVILWNVRECFSRLFTQEWSCGVAA